MYISAREKEKLSISTLMKSLTQMSVEKTMQIQKVRTTQMIATRTPIVKA